MKKARSASEATYPIERRHLPDGVLEHGRYRVRFAHDAEDLDRILRLRFEVFNLELGEGLEESFDTGRDRDEFDAVCHHLMVIDRASGDLAGTYRMQTAEMAQAYRGFYTDAEFRLGDLPAEVVHNAIELGRACVAASHRNTQTLFQLWRGLALYVATNRKRFLFGCSSLTSQDPAEALATTRLLEAKGHMHPTLRVEPQPEFVCYDGTLEPDPARKAKLPTLFRIYLRHGAKVCGPPAIDRRFKTIDYLVIFDVDAMDPKMFSTYFD